MTDIMKLSEYRDWLRDLKRQIKTEQIKAAVAVNSRLIMLYWDLGRQITEKQEKARWGRRFIEQLSKDLREEFPEMTGFSRTNLFRIKKFYQFYSSVGQFDAIVPQAVGQIQAPADAIVEQPVTQLQAFASQQDTIWQQLVSKLTLVP